jgi:Lar family restriction alleviation protein
MTLEHAAPCPFCWSDNLYLSQREREHGITDIYVKCGNCGSCGPNFPGERNAIVRWNGRPRNPNQENQ